MQSQRLAWSLRLERRRTRNFISYAGSNSLTQPFRDDREPEAYSTAGRWPDKIRGLPPKKKSSLNVPIETAEKAEVVAPKPQLVAEAGKGRIFLIDTMSF